MNAEKNKHHTTNQPNNFFDQHKDTVWVVTLFALWRGIIEIIGLFGTHNFSFLEKKTPWDPILTHMSGLWARWDSGWYLSIIQHGYYWKDPSLGQSNVAFFPFYPYLIKILSFPLQSNPFAVGMLFSSLFLAAALVVLFKLIRLDYSRAVAYRTLLFLLVFPMSFFFVSVYTESLFLLMSVSSLYFARKDRWFLASLFGFGAAFTRLVGIALILVLAVEYLHQREWKISKIRASFGYIWLIALGLFSYMFMLKTQLGNALIFLKAENAWNRTFQMPFHIIRDIYWPLVTHAAAYADQASLSKIFDFYFFAFAVILVVASFFVLRPSYALFSLFAFLPGIFTGTLESMGRYTLVLFPCFLLLSIAARWKPLEMAYILLSCAILSYNIILFVNWNWVA